MSEPATDAAREVEVACKAFAEASGYFTPWGVISPSAAKVRVGMRAALATLCSAPSIAMREAFDLARESVFLNREDSPTQIVRFCDVERILSNGGQ